MVLVGGLDRVSKGFALRFLPPDGAPRPLLGKAITLHLTHNSGAALSLGNDMTLIITLGSLVLLILLTVAALLTPRRSWAWTLALIIGGGMGNLVDRFQGHPWGTGSVIDFIDYFGFFVGNVADIFVVFGVVGVFVLMLRNVTLFETSSGDER